MQSTTRWCLNEGSMLSRMYHHRIPCCTRDEQPPPWMNLNLTDAAAFD